MTCAGEACDIFGEGTGFGVGDGCRDRRPRTLLFWLFELAEDKDEAAGTG